MKQLVLFSLILSIISCNNNKQVQTEIFAKEIAKTNLPKPFYGCNELKINSKLFSIADSILKIETHPNIVNLHSVDTTDVTVLEDYFIYPDNKSKMVFFVGEAGFSSGNSNCLLILFHCTNNSAKIIWTGQSNLFKKENFKDLDGDGVKEIINTSGANWLSSRNELFEIINFKNGKRKTLYSTLSNTQRDYFEEDWYCLGDTISCTYKNTILESDNAGIIKIKQIKTIKLYNGGKTREEAFKKCKVSEFRKNISLRP